MMPNNNNNKKPFQVVKTDNNPLMLNPTSGNTTNTNITNGKRTYDQMIFGDQ